MTELSTNGSSQQPTNGSERQPTDPSDRARAIFDFVSKHFALVSSITILVSLLATTVFLYAYLRVFDWRLIWIIEYPDIVKFGLVAFAIISVFAWWLTAYAQDVHGWVMAKEWTVPQKVSLAIVLAIAIFTIVYDEMSDNPHWAFHVNLGLSIGGLALLAWWFGKIKEIGINLTFKALSADAFFLIGMLALFGGTFGYYVRDFGEATHNVVLKNGELHHVAIVLITSHYIVLRTDQQVFVVPFTEVLNIVYSKVRDK